MAEVLTADQLNAIAQQSGYTGGSFSSVGLPATSTTSPTTQMSSPTAPTSYTQPTQQTYTQPTQQAPTTNLQPGAQGGDVKALQDYLVSIGYMSPQQVATGPGMYGPQTTAAIAKLQQDLGVQSGQYAGYYGPQTQKALQEKYQSALASLGSRGVPQTSADAKGALDSYFQGIEEPTDTMGQFYDALRGMNPIESMLFQQMAGMLSQSTAQQSFVDLYQQEIAAQGIPGLNMELANVQKIMEGTEDDIRDEISAAGGFATESQIQALTGARNKGLLKQANYLSNVLQAKNDYVDRIVSLTQADREQVSKDLDRKLGITETLFNMSRQMTNAARENYKMVVGSVGWGGLVNSFSNKDDLYAAAKNLGMSPGQLLRLGAMSSGMEDEVLSISEAKDLGVPYGTTRRDAYGIVPGGGGISKEEMAKNILTIRTSVRQEPAFKIFDDILNAYTNVKIGVEQNDAAGDLAIVNGIARMLDPTGVVRPAEFKTVEEAQGWLEKQFNLPFKVASGRITTPGARDRFMKLANELIVNKAVPIKSQLETTYAPTASALGVDFSVAVPEVARLAGIIAGASPTNITDDEKSAELDKLLRGETDSIDPTATPTLITNPTGFLDAFLGIFGLQTK